ncbi:MAG: hypothetical protein R3E76_01660 [Planctomycetota bacterium]
MGQDAPGSDKIGALREPLRRVDTVLNFARKLVQESGEVPPGLVSDFDDARKELEKAFVFNFDAVDEKLQKQLREFLQATKSLRASQIAKNVEKLSRRARSALNQLMIHGDGPLTLTSELGEVRFSDDDLKDPEPPAKIPAAAYALMTAPPGGATPEKQSDSSKSPALRRTLVAVVLIGVLGMIALAAAILVGPWSSPDPVYNTPINIVSDAGNEPSNSPPDNEPVIDESVPFDSEAAGYTVPLRVALPDATINPLEAKPDNLPPSNLAQLMLGYEELIQQIEPDRLAFEPSETRRRLNQFAQGAVSAEPGWQKKHRKLLDAFVEYVREELQLALYPPETSAKKVLVSDVLYSVGGGQMALVVTLEVLAQSCNAPLRLIAPLGASRPLLASDLSDGVHTFNGESQGLREGRQPVLLLSEALVEMSKQLRPTMDTPGGRILCSAVLLQHATLFTVDYARSALSDIELEWLAKPAEDVEPRELLLHELATRLQPAVCETLLKPIVNGDADEALAIYRLAAAMDDSERANRALLVLGERAAKGALLDGEPLPLVVGDLLARQGNLEAADKWYVRAMQEQPEDPRAVVRLLARKEGEARYDLCREAYARGERELGFMRLFIETAAKRGDDLLALKLLDEVIAGDKYDALDLEHAVTLCMSIGRTDWALQRLQDHREMIDGEPSLQRLELICELSLNGLTDRASQLAKNWRNRGEEDPYIEALLKRYGG